jgi:hypothetical protein
MMPCCWVAGQDQFPNVILVTDMGLSMCYFHSVFVRGLMWTALFCYRSIYGLRNRAVMLGPKRQAKVREVGLLI